MPWPEAAQPGPAPESRSPSPHRGKGAAAAMLTAITVIVQSIKLARDSDAVGYTEQPGPTGPGQLAHRRSGRDCSARDRGSRVRARADHRFGRYV